jgi:HSP20 family protein
MNTLTRKNRIIPSLNSFFNDDLRKDLYDWNEKNFLSVGDTLPSANVKDSEDEIRIDLAVPGMKKDDFKIQFKNNILSISSEKKDEKTEQDDEGNFLRKEFNYEAFCRTFQLPDNINEKSINAAYADGILHIEIGKKIIDSPKSTIDVPVK